MDRHSHILQLFVIHFQIIVNFICTLCMCAGCSCCLFVSILAVYFNFFFIYQRRSSTRNLMRLEPHNLVCCRCSNWNGNIPDDLVRLPFPLSSEQNMHLKELYVWFWLLIIKLRAQKWSRGKRNNEKKNLA